jgi:predicted dehydrogenase
MNHVDREIDRRRFIVQSSSGAAMGAALVGVAGTVATAAAQAAPGPNERIRVAVMGLGRGSVLAKALSTLPDAELAYFCDVDSRRLQTAVDQLGGKLSTRPKAAGDFRKILDDKSVDALVIAAPDHWHAPATIMACTAGKHVYVEKPCGHNPREGELAIEAARKHDRIVQVGTQRRSWPAMIEAVEKIRGNIIGRVLYARAWYANHRPSVGYGKLVPVPEWLDYDLWQGPAPELRYKDNYLHYLWHNYWHWGTGELGNNGVHGLDLCRWALGVDFPTRVTSGGGKYRYQDDQQTPDTHTVTFEFGDRAIFWEGLSWSPRGMEGEGFGATFHGERGTLVVTGNGYTIYSLTNKEVAKSTGEGKEAVHLKDFLHSIREHRHPNADIAEGNKSTLLCHLGNIAWRTGRTLHCDPQTGHILGDAEAMQFWSRQYRPGWEPKV